MTVSPYRAKRPKRRAFLSVFSRQAVRSLWDKGRHLLCHTIFPHDSFPSLEGFTKTHIKDSLKEEHLKVCQLIHDTGEQRRKTLEEKSTRTLSLVATLTPLLISAAVYTSTAKSLTSHQRLWILLFDVVALCLLFLAFIAAWRATAIRAFQALHIGAIIDEQSGTLKTFSPDYFGRGLLWCAAMNAAVHDHIADFVRASQLFIVCSGVSKNAF